MEQIKLEHPELFTFEFGKIAETNFVYTLSSPNINQLAPNLVKMYVAIRSRMGSIMNLIGVELFELFALEFAKIAESDFVSNIYKYKPISIKLGHNEFEHKTSDKFDYGTSQTRSVGVLCP